MLSLPIEGIPIHHEMKCTQYSTIDIDTNGSALGYTRFMQKHKKHFDEVITFEEEACFYLFWLCKFLINSSSKRIVTYYLPIAIALANKHKLALVPFFLGSIYRSMFFFLLLNLRTPLVDPYGLFNFGLMLIFHNLPQNQSLQFLAEVLAMPIFLLFLLMNLTISQILRIGLTYFLIRRELDLVLISFLLLRVNSLVLKCFFWVKE